MLSDDRRLGVHLPLGGGLTAAADRAAVIGANAIQVFSDNPSAWKRRAAPPSGLPAFTDRLEGHGIAPVVIHGAYLVNLAGPAAETRDRSVALVAAELRGAPAFGASMVNIHMGSHRGAGVEAGIERLAGGVALALAAATAGSGPDQGSGDAPAMLVLENSSGGGGGIGLDVDELARIAVAIDATGIPADRVGFCLDTAHAWGAGIDMAAPAAIDRWLSAFDRAIGLHRLVLVHLNDSRSERGSRQDRHEHLGAGRIGARGLGHVLRHRAVAHATFVLETPGMDVGYDAINMDRARALLAGRPLERLPAAAFELVGSARSRTAPA